jgi:hypothetical protein
MIKIFVASSTEALKDARQVCAWIKEAECEPNLWPDSYGPGEHTVDSLKRTAIASDAAVFILSADDKIAYRGNILSSPRDNIIFELGLFIGTFEGQSVKRAIYCVTGDVKVASDLAGLTCLQLDTKSKTPQCRQKIIDWCNEIKQMPARQHTVARTSTYESLFLVGTGLINNAREVVVLKAKTPIPIMGPRPYHTSDRKFPYEVEQYNRYWSLIEKAAAGDIRVTIIASLPAIADEINKVGSKQYRAFVASQILKIHKLTKNSISKLNLYWYEGRSPSTYLVSDHQSLLWWKASNQDSVWIIDRSPQLSFALQTHFEGIVHKMSYQAVWSYISRALRSDIGGTKQKF